MSWEGRNSTYTDIKRLFFGVEVCAEWPSSYPFGRIIDPHHRHFTLAFLGNTSLSKLTALLPDIPLPKPALGTAGYFDSHLSLPKDHPNVIAWHATWMMPHNRISIYQNQILEYLIAQGYNLNSIPWLPHLTLCRKPFALHAWQRAFAMLPFYTTALHLYESQGHLIYTPLHSWTMLLPFEEMEHTADLAFRIRGVDLYELYSHAWLALCFKMPSLLDFIIIPSQLDCLDDIIISLNQMLSRADCMHGIMFKAISFHGEIFRKSDAIYEWEMIVDV